MNINDRILGVAIALAMVVVTVTTIVASRRRLPECPSRHLSVEWTDNRQIVAIRINGDRIEATNGVVHLTADNFSLEVEMKRTLYRPPL